MNVCIFVGELNIEVLGLRILYFLLCVEVYNFRGILVSFLYEMKVRRCYVFIQVEFIGFLIKNLDIKVLEFEVYWLIL